MNFEYKAVPGNSGDETGIYKEKDKIKTHDKISALDL